MVDGGNPGDSFFFAVASEHDLLPLVQQFEHVRHVLDFMLVNLEHGAVEDREQVFGWLHGIVKVYQAYICENTEALHPADFTEEALGVLFKIAYFGSVGEVVNH